MKTLAVLSYLVLSAWAAPQVTFGADEGSVTSCGLVNGQERKVGDVWESDCNNCVCRDSGFATCTLRFCGNIPVLRPGCTDSSGLSRLHGSSWKVECNRCICTSGIVRCTQALCADRAGIKFAAAGSLPCPGCPQESAIDEDILSAADHAIASLTGISDSGCGGISLIMVERAEKQVVAGTNFLLTLRLETRGGQGCADKTQKICQNIVVFKPLSFACSSEDGCLELSNQEKISCREDIQLL